VILTVVLVVGELVAVVTPEAATIGVYFGAFAVAAEAA
jgi:hypothetical protein